MHDKRLGRGVPLVPLVVAATVAVIAALGTTVVPPAQAQAAPVFVGVSPQRILDTRIGLGGVPGPVAGGAPVSLVVSGGAALAPADAAAVSLNVTVTEPSQAGHLVVWPGGAAPPVASHLNYRPGATVANLVIARAGTGGVVQIGLSAGTAHVIVDVTGWFSGGTFQAVGPQRLSDTRIAGARLEPGQDLTVRVAGIAGVPAGGVAAVALNVTATDAAGPAHLTVWPSGSGAPLVSNLNLGAGDTVPNLVISGVGPDGAIVIRAAGAPVHVVVDLSGYFLATAGVGAVAPTRILDTRLGIGAVGPVAGGSTVRLPVLGLAGVPTSGVGGVVLNLTAVDPGEALFVTVSPSGTGRPATSSLNAEAGRTVANLVLVGVGDDGAIELYTSGTTHLVADVAAWTPGRPTAASAPATSTTAAPVTEPPTTTEPPAPPTTEPATTQPAPPTSAPTTVPTTTAPTTTAPTTTAPGPSAGDAAMLAAVNAARSTARSCGSAGNFAAAPPLSWNAELAAAAQLHSQDQWNTRTMTHTGSDGSNPGVRITRQGYVWRTYGENVAWNYANVAAVMSGWLGSAGHCANIMNPAFAEMGSGSVGTVTFSNSPANPGIYWTQVFATRR